MSGIRPATRSDAPFLAWTILAAGRSHVASSFWDLLLDRPGDPAIEAFLAERLVLAPWRSWWHHSHFWVVEVDGEPAAALSGFAVGDPEVRPPDAALLAALEGHGWDANALAEGLRRASPFFTCTTEADPAAWIVENVATRPEFRRRGLLARLLPEALGRGRAGSLPFADLSLFVGNTAAQRAYEAAGFAILDERRHPDFAAAIGCPGIARMRCPF